MDLSKLATQLKKDTDLQVPPFAAGSLEMARELGPEAIDLLLREIRAGGDTAFLALEALRNADSSTYNELPVRDRADIYAKALRATIFFNTWGLPNFQLSPTSEAVIALGDDAIASLESLLTDCRPAPVRGSHEGTVSSMYENRLCDYAWVLISEIRGQQYVYSKDPAERDREIERLRQELQGKTEQL
jgi:hypothetical protein